MPARKKQFYGSFLIENWRVVLPAALLGLLVLQFMGVDLKLMFFLMLAGIVLYLLRRRILRVFPKGKNRIVIQFGKSKISLTKKQCYMGAIALVAAWVFLSILGKIFWALMLLIVGFGVIAGGLAFGERFLPREDS
ncbi:hypothetical protein [Hirschia baltica]|uniref:Uncharacterized protein n=1 Tax=Hirschia baltica (strain ATCC 49814 / DSM 5838 / IFAM 1418) TaxID=582402 RepID=C6XIC0_HIRBI|nr:hypothetical protein [Hirschia baltica]ACT58946.1 hypothetical protein Hbal_1254 [Hirschia baltica ATCC 49814]